MQLRQGLCTCRLCVWLKLCKADAGISRPGSSPSRSLRSVSESMWPLRCSLFMQVLHDCVCFPALLFFYGVDVEELCFESEKCP